MGSVDVDRITNLQGIVDNNSDLIYSVIDGIIANYSKELDEYIDKIRNDVHKNSPQMSDLNDYCLNLSIYLYYASTMQERVGIKEDISRAIYKEAYNNSRNSLEKGTIADKDSIAELLSQHEYLTNLCYKRAYAIMKEKVSAGQELLASIKKIISQRMQEISLTHLS